MNARIYTHIYTYVQICSHTYAHTHTYIHTHAHIQHREFLQKQRELQAKKRKLECMYIYTHTYICIDMLTYIRKHTHIHTYTHTHIYREFFQKQRELEAERRKLAAQVAGRVAELPPSRRDASPNPTGIQIYTKYVYFRFRCICAHFVVMCVYEFFF